MNLRPPGPQTGVQCLGAGLMRVARAPRQGGAVVWNIDLAWFDTSGGRVRWLSVIDTGTGIAAEQFVPRFTEAPHLAATLGSGGRLTCPDPVSWLMTEAGWGRGRRTRQRRAPPSTARERGTKAPRVRSGFVPETRAKSAEFAGIRFSSLRRRQCRNIHDLQVKDRLDDTSSAVCHAEGRGFESLQPLSEKPRKREAFLLTRAPSSTLSGPQVKLWVKVR